MRSGYAILLAAVLITGVAAAETPDTPQDVEAYGHLKNLYTYEPTNDPDDWLGHGWMTAEFRVQRVLSGPKLPRVITVRYFGHTFIQDKRKVRLKLRRGEDGVYLLCVPAGSAGIQCP